MKAKILRTAVESIAFEYRGGIYVSIVDFERYRKMCAKERMTPRTSIQSKRKNYLPRVVVAAFAIGAAAMINYGSNKV